MKYLPWMVVLLMTLTACSGSKSGKKVDETSPQIELSDADEFIENPAEEPAPVATAEEPVTSDAPALADTSTVEEPVVISNEPAALAPASDFVAGAQKQYTVQKHETLMIIAFKLYGDYEKWRSLAAENQNALKGSTVVREGMVLNYTAPAEEFVWNPAGNPYLIRTGDTLGIISKNVYQTVKKWKDLWENNKPLIKDPNKIYAGFTLYYVDGREVASEQK